MSTATIAGLLLVVVPLAFNAAFALLAARFNDRLSAREPTPGGEFTACRACVARPGGSVSGGSTTRAELG